MSNEADLIQQDIDQINEAANDLKEKARIAGAAAWDVTKATYQQLQDKTVQYGKATDQAIRDNPYISLGIALGVGAILGFVVRGCRSSRSDSE